MTNAIDYFWKTVFTSLAEALVVLLIIAMMFTALHLMQEWLKARKPVLKYRKGYERALKDAVQDIERLYEEYEADDPLADMPNRKTIIARLENLKYVNKRNIPTE